MVSTLVFFPPSFSVISKTFQGCHSLKSQRSIRLSPSPVLLPSVFPSGQKNEGEGFGHAINGVCRRLNKHLLSHLEKEVSVGQRVIMLLRTTDLSYEYVVPHMHIRYWPENISTFINEMKSQNNNAARAMNAGGLLFCTSLLLCPVA